MIVTEVKKQYISRLGSGISRKNAQLYGETLEQISLEHGGELTPKLVVEKAKEFICPIHDYFEWDNIKAGDKYRLHQARMLIGGIEIIIIDNEDREKKVRNFFNVSIVDRDEKERQLNIISNTVYLNINEIFDGDINNPYRIQVIQQALDELNRWKIKYSIYNELEDIFSVIDRISQEIN